MSNKKTISIRAVNGSEIELSKRKEILNQLNKYRRQGEPETVEALEKRINDYLRWCIESDIMPNIETLSLAVGVHRTTFFRWTRGESKGRDRNWQKVCVMAKQMLNATLETEAEEGTLPLPVAIFALKNTAAWSDTRPLEAYEALMGGYGYTEPIADTEALLSSYKALYLEDKSESPDDETLSVLSAEVLNLPDDPITLPEWL